MKKNFITYIAHPDYYMLGRRKFSDICIEAAHRIARAGIEYDVPLEVNLNGFKYGKKLYQFNGGIWQYRYAYPFREFWEIVSTYDCKVLFGYDAYIPIAFLEKDSIFKANEILEGIKLNFIDKIVLK